MAELNRDGTAIHYEWYPSAAQDAPSILLSHGYSATASMWHGQIKALTTTHNLITWDMRGHGRSASPEDPNAYSEQLSVDDMAGILRECGVERAIIGGLSLGGYMTLAFHLAHPDMCDALSKPSDGLFSSRWNLPTRVRPFLAMAAAMHEMPT